MDPSVWVALNILCNIKFYTWKDSMNSAKLNLMWIINDFFYNTNNEVFFYL